MGYCSCATSTCIFLIFSLVPCVKPLGVLLPLYVYPGTGCAAWSPVSDAISAQSSTQWYIIVNPDSGPGPTDENYQKCVSQLPTATNRITMGYVDTLDGNVEADIDAYAAWDSSSRPTGIYFDNISPTASQLSTYQGYVSHAKSQGFTFIGMDPGQTVTDASYFSIADLINTYEDSYSAFNRNSLSGTISKQSVTLVNAPSTGSYNAVISQLESKGVAAVYITNVADSSQDLPIQLSEFVSEVASAGGGSAFPSPSDSVNPPSSAASGALSKAGSASVSSKPASSSVPSSPSQSTPVKGDRGASSTQPSVPSASSTNPSQPTSTTQKAPIATIVGGVLGALVALAILLLLVILLRRRRRGRSPTTPTLVAPYVVELPHPQLLNTNVKGPSPVGSRAMTNNTTAAAGSYAAPTHGPAASESLSGSTDPPPAYHN